MWKQEATQPVGEPAAEPKYDLHLKNYFGLEFEGIEIAEKFTAVTLEQENELRIMVQGEIVDVFSDVELPELEQHVMDGVPVDVDGMAEDGNTLSQGDKDAGCEDDGGHQTDANWLCDFYGSYRIVEELRSVSVQQRRLR